MKVSTILLCGLLILGVNSNIYGQNELLDSLRNQLTEVDEDTSKVRLLNTLAYQLHRINPEEGVVYALQSVELSKLLDFDKGRAHAYNSLGAGYWNMSELDSALKYYTKSYHLNDTLDNARGVTGALSNIAIIYENRGDYVKAIDAYSRALAEMKANGFESYVAITSNNLGLVLRELGKHPEALEYYYESIKIAEKLDMTNLLGPAWINVGNIYSDIGEPEKELEAKEKALMIGEESGDKYAIALALNNLGLVYRKRGDFGTALSYYERSLKINTEVGRKRSIATNLTNIGVVYRELDSIDSSIRYIRQSLKIGEEIRHQRAIVRGNYQLGLTFKKKGQSGQALSAFLKAFTLAKEAKMLSNLSDISEAIYKCYAETGQYEKAFFYQKEHTLAKDSLISEKNIKGLAKIEAQHEFEGQILAKQNEINLLEAREQITNLRILTGIAGALLIIGIVLFISISMIRKRNRRNFELESLNRFKEAMTGMIAHDLKTPLSVIMNSKGDIMNRQMAGQMLRLINNMLDVHKFESTEVDLNIAFCTVSDLVENALAQINHLAIEKEVEIRRELTDGIVEVDREIMIRILVNLLTNAVKYSPLNGLIIVKAILDEGYLTISISDDGVGIPEDQIDTIFKSFGQIDPKDFGGIGSTGLGLTFVKLALEAHGSEIIVTPQSRKGTTFSFELPLKSVVAQPAEKKAGPRAVLSRPEKEIILEKLSLLKKLNLHQISEIEKELIHLRNEENQVINQWAELMLNAAYTGNKKRYNELIEEVMEGQNG